MANKIDINLCKSAKANKDSVIAYLIVFSEYGMTNHVKRGFTPDRNPKMGKKGVTKLVFIYVKEPRIKGQT